MNKYFRTQIQNGPIAKRPQSPYSVKPVPAVKAAPASRRTPPLAPLAPVWPGRSFRALWEDGLSLLGLDKQLHATAAPAAATTAPRPYALVGLLLCGTLLAGGFMFSLRDRFIAHAFGREEVKLNSQADQSATERQQLHAQFEQAASPTEIERRARATGLAPLEFDQKKAGARKVGATEKTNAVPRVKSGRN